MKSYSVLFLIVFALSFSCSDKKKQFEHAGGKISMCLESTFLTKEPSEIGDYYSQFILGQCFEGLTSMDPSNLTVRPQLAKSYKILNDRKTYVFELREDVLFHEHAGFGNRKLTPEDVVYTIEKACSKRVNDIPTTAYQMVFKGNLKGADEFFHGKAESISGLEVKGNVLTMHLLKEDINFLQKLSLPSCAILNSKLEDETSQIVGTGPFVLTESNIQPDQLILVKNQDYYLKDQQGNALPYLDTLQFFINSRKLRQLDLFEQGVTDLILGLPTSRITKMLEGRIEDFNSIPPLMVLHDNPQLVTNYYFFNLKDPRFQDVRVRKAFNHAINKYKIGQSILRNQYAELGNYGIVPPLENVMRGYDYKSVGQYACEFNPRKAKAFLAEAGYPDGEGFGSVTLRFDMNDVHSAIADEISKQISQTLNINVNIDGSSFPQLTRDGDMGNGDLFRSAWSADYPSPESFLINFYGKLVPDNPEDNSYVNPSRYKSEKFDAYFEKARMSQKLTERMDYFSKADAELMKDAAIIPLWYNGEIQIVYSNVRNLRFNSMDLFVFREVYKKDWTKEEYLAKTKPAS